MIRDIVRADSPSPLSAANNALVNIIANIDGSEVTGFTEGTLLNGVYSPRHVVFNVGIGSAANFQGEYWASIVDTNFYGGSSNTASSIIGASLTRVIINSAGVIARAIVRQTEIEVPDGDIGTIVMHRMVMREQADPQPTTSLIYEEVELFSAAGLFGTVIARYIPNTQSADVSGTKYLDLSEPRDVHSKINGKIINHAGHERAAANHPGIANNLYYTSDFNTVTPIVLSAAVLYWTPIFVPARMQVTEYSINVTTGVGGGLLRLGVYTSLAGYPSLPLGVLFGTPNPELGEGVFATDTTGVKTIAANRLLDSGMYWLAFHSANGTHAVSGGAFTPEIRANFMGRTSLIVAAASNANTSWVVRAYGSNLPLLADASVAPRQTGSLSIIGGLRGIAG